MIDIKDIREEDLTEAYSNVATLIGLAASLKLGKKFGGENFNLCKLRDCKALEDLAAHDPRYADIIKVLGLEATWKLVKEFGGETFYLPKLDGTRGPLTRARERMILTELKTFQGSIVALARKYGITSRCVQNIIKREHVKRNAETH